MITIKTFFDSLSFSKKLLIVIAALSTYFLFSELVLSLVNVKLTDNEYEDFIAGSFTEEEWKEIREIQHELNRRGTRVQKIEGTVLYLYKEMHSKLFNINSDGFRGKEITPKKDDELRILIAGSSIMFGICFPDGKSIPDLIQKKARKKIDKKLLLYNVSVEGFVLQRNIAFAKRIYQKIKPDRILFYFGGNDIGGVFINKPLVIQKFNKSDKLDIDLFEKEALRTQNKWAFLKNIALVNQILTAVRNRIHQVGTIAEKTGNTQQKKELPKEMKIKAQTMVNYLVQQMIETDEFYKKQGIPVDFLFVSNIALKKHPTFEESKALQQFETIFPYFSSYSRYVSRYISQQTDKENISFINLSNTFDSTDKKTFFDIVHLSPHGQELMADRITEILLKDLE